MAANANYANYAAGAVDSSSDDNQPAPVIGENARESNSGGYIRTNSPRLIKPEKERGSGEGGGRSKKKQREEEGISIAARNVPPGSIYTRGYAGRAGDIGEQSASVDHRIDQIAGNAGSIDDDDDDDDTRQRR